MDNQETCKHDGQSRIIKDGVKCQQCGKVIPFYYDRNIEPVALSGHYDPKTESQISEMALAVGKMMDEAHCPHKSKPLSSPDATVCRDCGKVRWV